MGLFDNLLKKATKMVTDNVINEVKKTVRENLNINTDNFSTTPVSISERYDIFPKYPGKMIGKPFEKETKKYFRVTMRYEGMPDNNFIMELTGNGFVKGSEVRYDKDNIYVIIDYLRGNNQTEIVYHIKK